MKMKLFAIHVGVASAAQLVVNDNDAGAVGSNWGTGWFGVCDDAYGATPGDVNYHMDWAGERGEVSVGVKADGISGCVKVEEWHPGRAATCSRYLVQNAPLTLHLSTGETETVLIDQSQGGGQWNVVGTYSLTAESVKATFSNGGGGLKCDADLCWWTADAWRFTEQPAEACSAVASAEASRAEPEYAEVQASVAWAECAQFGEDLLEVVDACAGANTCSAPEFARGHACRAEADAFSRTYEFIMARCLMGCMREKAELKMRGREVEAALACPESNAADEQAVALDALQGKQTALRADVTQAADAVDFDGDCTEFTKFAQQVVDHCADTRCCSDVVQSDSCRYYASGLHSLYPMGAINYCIKYGKVKLNRKCSCFVRQVSACAVQAEVHEILYNEEWNPTCSVFPAMARQQDPADHSGGVLRLPLFAVLIGVALLSACCFYCGRKNAKTTSHNEEEVVDAPTAEEVDGDTILVSAEEYGVEVKNGKPVHMPVLVVDGEQVAVVDVEQVAVA